MEFTPAYGRRLMPTVLDDLAARSPARVYAAVPKTNDVKDGFRDITVADVARMVNFIAWWVEGRFGKSDKFEAIGYIGIADVRGPILFQGLVKSGFKVLECPPPLGYLVLIHRRYCYCLHATQRPPTYP